MPIDDTIPQNNEGVQMITQAITPRHAADLLLIAHVGVYTCSTGATGGVALFQDNITNALAAVSEYFGASNQPATIPLIYQTQATSTSSTTFKIRAGASSGDIAMNGLSTGGTRIYGGVCYSALSITEIFI